MNSIFITGAGAGIGRATAHCFADQGWFVGAADLDEAALHSLQDELGEARCSIHVTDVVDPASVRQSLAGFAARTDGRLDVLHNNAGLLRGGRFEAIHLEDHRQLVDVNLTGLINVLHVVGNRHAQVLLPALNVGRFDCARRAIFQYLKGAIQRNRLRAPTLFLRILSIPQRCDSEAADLSHR